MLHACAILLLAAAPADPAADLFNHVGPVPKVRITLDEANLKQLKQNARQYVRGTFRVSGAETLNDLGLHLKGAAGSTRGWDDKPGLTLNADKFAKNQTFRGLDKFHLNNCVQDGSHFHEILANELALAAGLPACRCTHALVELNGRKVGLYVLKEGFDKTFLKRHFADASGTLYDGGFLTDINANLEQDSGPDVGRKDLKALTKACSEGDREKRFAETSKLLDVDRFYTLVALQIITADWDGYARNRNNYRVYFDPKTGQATFLPHGMDQMWQNPGEGIWHGWGGLVAQAVLNHPEGKKKALERLKEMCDKHFTTEKMHKRIDELLPRAKEAVGSVSKDWVPGFENEVKWLKERIKQRVEYIKRELPKLMK